MKGEQIPVEFPYVKKAYGKYRDGSSPFPLHSMSTFVIDHMRWRNRETLTAPGA